MKTCAAIVVHVPEYDTFRLLTEPLTAAEELAYACSRIDHARVLAEAEAARTSPDNE